MSFALRTIRWVFPFALCSLTAHANECGQKQAFLDRITKEGYREVFTADLIVVKESEANRLVDRGRKKVTVRTDLEQLFEAARFSRELARQAVDEGRLKPEQVDSYIDNLRESAQFNLRTSQATAYIESVYALPNGSKGIVAKFKYIFPEGEQYLSTDKKVCWDNVKNVAIWPAIHPSTAEKLLNASIVSKCQPNPEWPCGTFGDQLAAAKKDSEGIYITAQSLHVEESPIIFTRSNSGFGGRLILFLTDGSVITFQRIIRYWEK